MKEMVLAVSKFGEGMVVPCEATPSGMLSLSVIDALPAMRAKVRSLQVFRHGPNAAAVIRDALSKALVHYYPLAGRIVESPVLQLSCTGEGVWFVEASAQCNLEAIDYLDSDFMDWRFQLLPPSPPEKDGFDPLVLVQITQFTCEGFVMGLEFSHCVCDGLGAAQFIKAVGEFARGLQLPTIPPAWCRESLPPPMADEKTIPQPPRLPPPVDGPNRQLAHANVDITPDFIAGLKRQFLELTGKHCSTFEALVARVWRCRARAISTPYNSNDVGGGGGGDDDDAMTTLVFLSNVRGLMVPPLPEGFYGNCVFPVIVSLPLERLSRATHVETVKLIQEAKAKMPTQFAEWMATASRTRTVRDDGEDGGGGDFFVPPPLSYGTLFVSEWGRLGFEEVDFGWGPAIHHIPVPYSSTVPAVCILGCPPSPRKGVRLMTWSVYEPHLNGFRQLLINEP